MSLLNLTHGDTLPAMDIHGETLAEFLIRFWKARLWVLLGSCAGLLVGVVLLLSLQPHYEASMIIAPSFAQEESDSFASFETGRTVENRALALMTEKSLPPEFTRFEQILREQTVANILAKYDGILEKVGEERIWRIQPHHTMDAKDLGKYLHENVRVEPIGASSSRRISYAHPDPDFAVQLLKRMHTIADTTIRQKTAAETQDRIGWLQKELGQTGNPDHRTALTTLLMKQERRRMLVAMDQPYTAEIVEPPSVASRPAWPPRMLTVLVAMVLGACAGFVSFTLRRHVA